jgi:hypothetical protein
MGAVDTLVDVVDKFGVLQAIKSKLVRQPDPAAEKLAVVLEEVSKVYGALDSELSKFLSISFDESGSPEENDPERGLLTELEGAGIQARVGRARGHCKKIGNIYQKYLLPWFDRVLPPPDREQMQDLFLSLDEFDGQMMMAIGEVAGWLADEAKVTLDLADAGNYVGANDRVRKARGEILPKRRAISAAMSRLYDLQADFVEASGVV